MARPMPDVEIVDVTKRFGTVTAVDRMRLSIARGEFYSLLGPSGCSKTTTLRMIAGFEQPTEGEIFLDGEPIVRRQNMAGAGSALGAGPGDPVVVRWHEEANLVLVG